MFSFRSFFVAIIAALVAALVPYSALAEEGNSRTLKAAAASAAASSGPFGGSTTSTVAVGGGGNNFIGRKLKVANAVGFSKGTSNRFGQVSKAVSISPPGGFSASGANTPRTGALAGAVGRKLEAASVGATRASRTRFGESSASYGSAAVGGGAGAGSATPRTGSFVLASNGKK